MLTIFANIRVNDEEGLQHLKDSFHSFNTVSDNWLINVRGTLRIPVIEFLTKELEDRMILFQLLDDSRGWIENALQMLPSAKHEYLLIWNEDHLNTAPQHYLVNVVKEMAERQADYLLCSWWIFGNARKAFDVLPLERGTYIDTTRLTKKRWSELRMDGYPYYILSLVGIYRRSFFEQLLLKDRVKMPLFVTKNLYRAMALLNHLGMHLLQTKYFHIINKFLFHKLRYFPKETPFDLEKGPDRTDMLPYTIALPKQELFACIDDDLNTPGYQLIKRGKYPVSFSLQVANMDGKDTRVLESNRDYEISKVFLSATETYRRAYYEDTERTAHLLKETVIVMGGKVIVETGGEKGTLVASEMVSTYPNIGYTIIALEDTQLIIISPSLRQKTVRYLGQQGLQKRNHD